MKAPRVLVGIPSLQMVDVNFAVKLTAMVCHSVRAGIGVVVQPVVNYALSNAHNALIKDARLHGCTHLMFVETDNTFPPDALLRLLGHGKDIVGATYLTRSAPHWTMGLELHGKSIDVSGGGCREVKNLPVGCVLIDMKVIDAIETPGKPVFEMPWDDLTQRFSTDDYPFFGKCREAGFSVWCDCDLSMEVGHMATLELKLTDHADVAVDAYRRMVA